MKITHQRTKYRKPTSTKEKDLYVFLKSIKIGDEIVANTSFGPMNGTVIDKYLGWPVINPKSGMMGKFLYFFKSFILSIYKAEKKNKILQESFNSKTIRFNLDEVNLKIQTHKKFLKYYQGKGKL